MDSAAPSFRSEQTERFLAAAPSTLIPNHPFPMLSGKPPQKTESKPLKAKVRKSVTITIRSSELWFVVQLSRLFTFGAPVNPLRRAEEIVQDPQENNPSRNSRLRERNIPVPFCRVGDISFSAPPAHRQEYQGSAAIVSKASLQTAFFLYTSTLPAGT